MTDLHAAISRVPVSDLPLRVRTVGAFTDLTLAERIAWRRLCEAAPDPAPHPSLEWLESWWRTVGAPMPRVRRELMLTLVSRGAGVIAVYPIVRETRRRLWRSDVRYLSPLGHDRNLTKLPTALVRHGHEAAAGGAFLRHVRARWADWDPSAQGTGRLVLDLAGDLETAQDRPAAVTVG